MQVTPATTPQITNTYRKDRWLTLPELHLATFNVISIIDQKAFFPPIIIQELLAFAGINSFTFSKRKSFCVKLHYILKTLMSVAATGTVATEKKFCKLKLLQAKYSLSVYLSSRIAVVHCKHASLFDSIV